MRLPTVIAVILLLAPAITAAHPSSDRRDRPAPGRDASSPAIVREADGSTTLRRPLPAYQAELDGFVRVSGNGKVAPSPLGRRRSPSEQAIDEDLERAFEQAAETARFGAPD